MSDDQIIGTELTCREICDFVMAYLDGELPAREQAVFAAHLKICPECECYLKSYQATVRLGKDACAEPCAPPIPDDLVKAILAARKQTPPS